MVAIFTRTTSVLSTQFVGQFSADKLAQTLYKVGQETGVKFYREEETFGISGQWREILNAYDSLEKLSVQCTISENPTSSVKNTAPEVAQQPKVRINVDDNRRGRKPGSSPRPKSAFSNIPKPLVVIDHGDHLESLRNNLSKSGGNAGAKFSEIIAESSSEKGSKDSETESPTVDKSPSVNDTAGVNVNSKLLLIKSELNDASSEKLSKGNSESKPKVADNADLDMRNDSDDSGTDIDERYNSSETTEQQKQSLCGKAVKVQVKVEPTDDGFDTVIKETIEKNTHSVSERKGKKKEYNNDGQRKYSCSKCTYFAYKSETLKSHCQRKHRTKKFICDVCDKKFGVNKDLNRHKLQVHSDPVSCRFCKKKYKCKKSLEEHLKIHVKDTKSEQLGDAKSNETLLLDCETIETENGEKGYKCNQCDYVGNKLSLLRGHIKRMHRIRFTCDECGKKFGYMKDLNRHKKWVHSEASFVCEICKKLYKSKRSFEEHVQTHNEDYVKENFRCDLCPKAFCNKYVLAGHVKSEHLGIKNSYICPTCGKSFTQKSTYMVHANVHAGIKPYVCEKCGYAFAYENSYKRHRDLHDNTVKYTCEICSKTFPHPTNLRTHMKTHAGKKDYLCTTCGREFTQKHALMRHERIHTGVKPFVCDICQRSFTDLSIVRRHLMLMHKKGTKEWRKFVISHVKKSVGYFIERIDAQEKAVIPLETDPLPDDQAGPDSLVEQPNDNGQVLPNYTAGSMCQTTALDVSENMPHPSHTLSEPSNNMARHLNSMQSAMDVLPFHSVNMSQPSDMYF